VSLNWVSWKKKEEAASTKLLKSGPKTWGVGAPKREGLREGRPTKLQRRAGGEKVCSRGFFAIVLVAVPSTWYSGHICEKKSIFLEGIILVK